MKGYDKTVAMKINISIIKRALSFLCATLTVLLLVSCAASSDSSESDTTGVQENTAAESLQITPVKSDKEISDEAIAALLQTDFGGDNVIIVTSNDDAVLPDDTEDVVNRKRYERFNILEGKFNFTFVKRRLTDAAIYTGAKSAHNSELYYADLIYVSPSQLYRYQIADMAANIAALPFVTLDAPYFDSASMEQASADGFVYAAVGESNFNADNLVGVFFNKELLAELGEIDLYKEVYDGNWTLEMMTELSRSTAYGADGKTTGLRGTLTDLTVNTFIDNAYYSAMGLNVSAGSDILPTYTPFDEAAQSCADLIYGLMYNRSGFTNTDNARKRFESGESLFCVTTLSEKNNIADSSFNWGILPMPLYEAGCEYRALKNNGFTVTVVLSSTPDPTRSGILLEGINAAMYGYVEDAYFDECMYEIVRDNDTLNMIDIISDSAKCDFAFMFSGGITDLDDCTYEAVRNTVKSARTLEYYNNKGSKINERLTKAFER